MDRKRSIESGNFWTDKERVHLPLFVAAIFKTVVTAGCLARRPLQAPPRTLETSVAESVFRNDFLWSCKD